MKQSIKFFLLSIMLASACKKNGGSPASPEIITPPPTPQLAIADFSPKIAKPEATLTITGTGFGTDRLLVKVAIGASSYDYPLSVSPTTITLKTNRATLSGKIKVLVGNFIVTSTDDYTALPPDLKVTGYYAHEQLGKQFYISGDGFGEDKNKLDISFGGAVPVKANSISATGLTIGVVIPRNAQPGKITVTLGSQSATGDVDFAFDTSVRDFSPKSAAAGDTVKITGEAFTNANDMGVYFGDNGFTKAIKVTTKEMLAIVPANASSGYLTIAAASGTVRDLVYGDDFKFILIPTVSFSSSSIPSAGKVGDVIRINGSFNGANITEIGVSFSGSKPVQPTSISGADIYVKIPGDAKTGKITISRTGYRSFTHPYIFTINP